MNFKNNNSLSSYHKILLILMIVSTLVLGSIILLKSKASFTITPSSFTPSVGGNGGSETGLQSCPIGTVAIGMEGKDVTQADAIREGFGYISDYSTRCGTYTIDPSTKTVTTTYDSTTPAVSGFIIASRTPLPKSVDCPNGSVLGGYTGFQKFNASHNTTLVNALKPRCSTLTIDPVTNLLVVGPKTDSGLDYVVTAPAAGSDPIAKADCDANSVVTGFQGRVGELFDLFKLACGNINQTSLSISIIELDYSQYQIIATDSTGAKTIFSHKEPTILTPDTYTLQLENKLTGEIAGKFDCKTEIVVNPNSNLSPYQVKLTNNSTNYCTVNPNVVLPRDNKPAPVIDKKPISEKDTAIITTKIDTTIVPTTQANTMVTTRTGGIYISVISAIILGVVGILLFLKLKRKN
jgi:hypothetical protein